MPEFFSGARYEWDCASSMLRTRTSPPAHRLRRSATIAATVLLVDTDPEERSSYTTALTRFANRVCVAATFTQAKSTLLEECPDVLVTQVRLGEFNGIHLAAWGRRHLPDLRTVIIGQSDPTLEADVHASGLTFFLQHNDVKTMLHATLEAVVRENPRRRWLRKRLASSLVAHINGSPSLVLDVSYGGLRVQTLAPFVADVDRRVALDIPALGIRTDITCRWVTPLGAPGPYWCGATVNDVDIRAGSRWRVLVDALLPAPGSGSARTGHRRASFAGDAR